MVFGDETPSAVPVPWGGLLVLGVLAVSLVALGGEKASSPRTRKMRANGRRRARRTLSEPATLVVRASGKVVLAQAADWADGAMQYTPYPSMEAFRDEWEVRTVATEDPQPEGVGYTARFPDAVALLFLAAHKGKRR